MKHCSTCGMQAEETASFCPCCGSSFVTAAEVPAPIPKANPAPAKKSPKPTVKTPPPFFEERKKTGGHAPAVVIITVLAIAAVGLSALWLTGGLEAMLAKDNTAKATQAADEEYTTTPSVPTVAAIYDGGEITTEQYLAYLYLEYERVYDSLGLALYEANGQNPWELTLPYGYDGEQLLLSDYIVRATEDDIKRQIVLRQMMREYGIAWIDEDKAALDKSLAMLEQDAYIDFGFDNDAYAYALKNGSLNERATFYGLYEAGGARAVDELTLRQYYTTNYLSYKMISIPLTDSLGQALTEDSDAYAQILAKTSDYLTTYEQHGFDVVYVQHTGGSAAEARVDEDATHMDPELAAAVRTVAIGEATIVEYVSGGTTPTIALIQRLDPNEVYAQHVEDVIYTLRYETFNAEVTEAMEALAIIFDPTVVATCKPEEFLTILNAK